MHKTQLKPSTNITSCVQKVRMWHTYTNAR